ncbi:hypothetical protein F2Q68_00045268 [Brassica cretica]|uniref:Uncharacterized protein n=1 Tax=Brassica cretica TaxID=69181 RepID=A0A8S9LLZ6_BRACR|nr:hypothetical protein F2Q68_00045268 [Brassica cretica]
MHIYASCGVWTFDPCKGWGFAFDKEKGGRVLAVELTSSFEDLRTMAFEDFGIDQNDVELELTYLPMELCVPISPVNANNDNIELDKEQSNASGRERGEPFSFSPRDGIGSSSESSKDGEDECNSNAPEEDEDADLNVKEEEKGKSVRFSLKDVVKRGVPEDSWVVPYTVRNASVLAPESRRGAGRRRKHRYETVEDKLRSSQGAQEKKGADCELKLLIKPTTVNKNPWSVY